jgi:hypothetical protein
MITLHENKHITNRYTLAEIREQMVDGEYSAELLLHHLCLHANEMQSRLEIGQLIRDDLRSADDDRGLGARWDALVPPKAGHEPRA